MKHHVKILIAMHKPCKIATEECYLPVFVGADGKELTEDFPKNTVRDDDGENISKKNDCYCELTALYWAWKNLQADYIGLVHYRRYFKGKGRKKIDKVLHEDALDELLDRYSVILPKKRKYYIETVYSHYAHTISGEQLDITREILKSDSPQYLAAFDKIMKQRSCYLFNMFIMRRDLFEKYCDWLFPILEKLEQSIDKTNMSDFDRRFCGRVSELLLNVWLTHMIELGELSKSDTVGIPVIYMEKVHYFRKIMSFLGAKFFHKKYEKSF